MLHPHTEEKRPSAANAGAAVFTGLGMQS